MGVYGGVIEGTGERGFEPRLTDPESVVLPSEALKRQTLSDLPTCDSASCLAPIVQSHPELTKLIEAWPDLSADLREAILRMVRP